MIVNPGKFPAIIVYIRKKDHKNQRIKIGNKAIQSSLSVKQLDVNIDNKLNFNFHIKNICRSAANQLNAFIKLKNFLNFDEKKILGIAISV